MKNNGVIFHGSQDRITVTNFYCYPLRGKCPRNVSGGSEKPSHRLQFAPNSGTDDIAFLEMSERLTTIECYIVDGTRINHLFIR
jgi:hypothetical protein